MCVVNRGLTVVFSLSLSLFLILCRSNVESSCVLAKRAQRVTILRIYSLCEAVCPAQDQFLSPDKTDWLSMSLREIWEEMERSYLQSCQLAPRLCNMQDFHRFGHVDLPTEGLDTLPALPVLEYTTSISQQLMAVNKSVSETWDASLKSLREACAVSCGCRVPVRRTRVGHIHHLSVYAYSIA